ncbi:MAG: aminotransferase class I/II-fold pyridoxal phosphate-dependent enzyme [Planctomycetes bacterium]|nr:aminotransferase class I/II-fold pyridoxal phosphate-dependent enzyme [Planctomycetota bacterium]
MPEPVIDLRSDTVTKPTPAMREFIARAEVADDVFSEDPTVNQLQKRVAELLGKEAAVYVPSGTMSNQVAVKAHTQPGDEVLCEATCHIYNYEAGGPAVLSHVMCRTIPGRFGILDVGDFEGMIRPPNEHYVRTRLVCLENTHNRGGGRIYPLENIERICAWADEHGLVKHLDGARLMNAVAATGVPAREYAKHFDTVSICFSKGLGAPIGSALAGPAELIARARRIRKVFGGGMRQGGIAAAGALYAIEHNIDRLAEDHANAQVISQAIRETEGLRLVPPDVETNIIWFQVDPELGTAAEVAARMKPHGVLFGVGGPQTLRACTHLDVSRSMAQRAGQVIREVVPNLNPRRPQMAAV